MLGEEFVSPELEVTLIRMNMIREEFNYQTMREKGNQEMKQEEGLFLLRNRLSPDCNTLKQKC